MFFGRMLVTFLLMMAIVLAFPPRVHAYLDPGTGSFILQLLLAGIVGLVFVLKAHWRKIRAFFVRNLSKDRSTEAQVGKDEDV